MLRFTLLLLTLATCVVASGQDIAELERRNGFKDLKLGLTIDSVKGEKKIQKRI